MLKLAWDAARWELVAVICFTLVAAVLPTLIAFTGKSIIDSIQFGTASQPGRSGHVLLVVAFELILVVSSLAVEQLISVLQSKTAAELSHCVTMAIMRRGAQMSLAEFEDPAIISRLERARNDAFIYPSAFVVNCIQLLRSLCVALCGAIALGKYNTWLSLSLVTVTIPIVIIQARIASFSFELRRTLSPLTKMLQYLSLIPTSISHAKEVKLFGYHEYITEKYATIAGKVKTSEQKAFRKQATWLATIGALPALIVYISYGIAAVQAAKGEISLGTMTFYMVSCRLIQGALQNSAAAFSAVLRSLIYLEDLSTVVLEPRDAAEVTKVSAVASRLERGIRMENVSFRYRGSGKFAVSNISTFIPAGTRVAIVGRNGCGKSTLLKLLLGLYAPSSGRVLIDGEDIQACSREHLDQKLTGLFQDFSRYELTVRENLALSKVAEIGNTDRVLRCIDAVANGELSARLRTSLDVNLGQSFENSMELSGGEWQRVAAARVLYKSSADYVFLDEPSASLDPQSERQVVNALVEQFSTRTIVLTTHRRALIDVVDHVLVLKEGRIVGEGSPLEIQAPDGEFMKIFGPVLDFTT